jgi:hypothetical protein
VLDAEVGSVTYYVYSTNGLPLQPGEVVLNGTEPCFIVAAGEVTPQLGRIYTWERQALFVITPHYIGDAYSDANLNSNA